MKLSAGIAAQGTLLLAQVSGPQNLPEMTGEWNGRGIGVVEGRPIREDAAWNTWE